MARIELPTNYGMTYLELSKSKSGKFICLLLDMFLRSVSFIERLSLRTLLDRYVSPRSTPKPCAPKTDSPVRTSSSSNQHVAVSSPYNDTSIVIGKLSDLNVSTSVEFSSHVSCFSFIQTPTVMVASILVVGLVSGDLEVYKVSDTGNKLVYRMKLPEGTHAVGISHGSGKSYRFQVLLSMGKCVLDFDTVAVVSGNSDDYTCTVVDLIHQSPMIDCDVLTDESLLASLSADGRVVVTDLDSGNSVRFTCNFESPSRILWDQATGHLLVADEKSGRIMDFSWSNGLVGVATRPNRDMIERGIVPENVHKFSSEINVNTKCMDMWKNTIVSVYDNDLHVYTKSETESGYPISQLNPHYVHEKQTHVGTNREVIVGVIIVSKRKIVMACRHEGGVGGHRFRSIDI